MQAEDNGFYLNRDELREYSTWGCYYADCRDHLSGRDALDTNTVIYGHSANDCDPDGVRFTKLYRAGVQRVPCGESRTALKQRETSSTFHTAEVDRCCPF